MNLPTLDYDADEKIDLIALKLARGLGNTEEDKILAAKLKAIELIEASDAKVVSLKYDDHAGEIDLKTQNMSQTDAKNIDDTIIITNLSVDPKEPSSHIRTIYTPKLSQDSDLKYMSIEYIESGSNQKVTHIIQADTQNQVWKNLEAVANDQQKRHLNIKPSQQNAKEIIIEQRVIAKEYSQSAIKVKLYDNIGNVVEKVAYMQPEPASVDVLEVTSFENTIPNDTTKYNVKNSDYDVKAGGKFNESNINVRYSVQPDANARLYIFLKKDNGEIIAQSVSTASSHGGALFGNMKFNNIDSPQIKIASAKIQGAESQANIISLATRIFGEPKYSSKIITLVRDIDVQKLEIKLEQNQDSTMAKIYLPEVSSSQEVKNIKITYRPHQVPEKTDTIELKLSGQRWIRAGDDTSTLSSRIPEQENGRYVFKISSSDVANTNFKNAEIRIQATDELGNEITQITHPLKQPTIEAIYSSDDRQAIQIDSQYLINDKNHIEKLRVKGSLQGGQDESSSEHVMVFALKSDQIHPSIVAKNVTIGHMANTEIDISEKILPRGTKFLVLRIDDPDNLDEAAMQNMAQRIFDAKNSQEAQIIYTNSLSKEASNILQDVANPIAGNQGDGKSQDGSIQKTNQVFIKLPELDESNFKHFKSTTISYIERNYSFSSSLKTHTTILTPSKDGWQYDKGQNQIQTIKTYVIQDAKTIDDRFPVIAKYENILGDYKYAEFSFASQKRDGSNAKAVIDGFEYKIGENTYNLPSYGATLPYNALDIAKIKISLSGVSGDNLNYAIYTNKDGGIKAYGASNTQSDQIQEINLADFKQDLTIGNENKFVIAKADSNLDTIKTIFQDSDKNMFDTAPASKNTIISSLFIMPLQDISTKELIIPGQTAQNLSDLIDQNSIDLSKVSTISLGDYKGYNFSANLSFKLEDIVKLGGETQDRAINFIGNANDEIKLDKSSQDIRINKETSLDNYTKYSLEGVANGANKKVYIDVDDNIINNLSLI